MVGNPEVIQVNSLSDTYRTHALDAGLNLLCMKASHDKLIFFNDLERGCTILIALVTGTSGSFSSTINLSLTVTH